MWDGGGGQDWAGSEEGQMASSCENGTNQSSYFVKCVEFLD